MKFLSDILAKAGLVVDGTVTLNSVANATTDTDRFIVVDSGVVKYRTGTQLLSDIGGISGNQTITLSGDATGSGTTAITVTLANSGVTAGTYGGNNSIPSLVIDAKGRVTSASTVTPSGTWNINVTGSAGSATQVVTLQDNPPTGLDGKLWWETDTGRLKVYYAATSAWVDALPMPDMTLYYPKAGGSITGDVSILQNLSVTGNTLMTGTVTASSLIKSGGTSSQFLKADGSVDSSTYATTSYVTTQINNLVNGAPGLLDTLDELAAALGDDPNFATTITTALSNRLRIDIGTQGLTSTQQGYGRTNLGLGSLATLSSVGNAQITDVAWSKVTGAPAFITGNQTITLSGDATGSGATAITVTLANSGVTSGTYNNVTVDAKGRVTSGSNVSYLTSYTETDTLATVTGRGASTSTALTLNGGATIAGLTVGGDIAFSGSSRKITVGQQNRLVFSYQTFGTVDSGSDRGGWMWNAYYDWSVPGYKFMNTNSQGAAMLRITNSTLHFHTKAGPATSDASFSWDAQYDVYHSGNLTNLNQLTNGPGYITSSALSSYLPLSGGTLTGALSGTSATFSAQVLVNLTNGYGFALNRPATTNYIGISYRTNGSFYWFVGMRENSTNDYIIYSEQTATDYLRINSGTGAATFNSSVTAGSFVKSGGTSSQFLKADGSVDSSTYATQSWVQSQGYLTSVSDVWVNTSGDTMTGSLVIRNTGSFNNIRVYTEDDNSWIEQTKPDGTIVGRMGFDGYSTSNAYYTEYAVSTRSSSDAGLVRRIYINDSRALVLENLNGFSYNGNTVWHSGNLTNLNQLTNGPGYITGNQTITLTGNVTGSGTTSIATTIANGVVTNAMLVNSSFNIGTTSISLGRASAAQTLTGVSIDGTAKYLQNNYIATDANLIWQSGVYTFFNGTNVPGGDFGMISIPTWGSTDGSSRYNLQIGSNISGNPVFRTTNINGAGTWYTFWHSGNLTNLNQLTNGPGYITSYTETDTLQSVVSRGRTAAVGFTTYTGDGIYDAAATPVTFSTPHSSTTRIGYHDGGGGQYAATIGFLNTGYYSGLAAIRSRVSGEANDRFTIYHSGQIAWGAGGASGLDTNLYRDSADVLRTDDSFVSSVGLTVLRNLGTDNYSTVGQHNMHLRLRKSSLDGGCAPRTLELGVLDNGTGIIQANHCGVGYNTLALNPVSGTVTINGNTAWHQGNLTNLNQLTNGPGYITSYTETDTLATVTGRGATTTAAISVNSVTGSITSSGSGDSNAPFRFGADYSGWMTIVAGTPGSNNGWGLFWAGNSGAQYGTNGTGGPGDIWTNSSNPNEYVFVGNGQTNMAIHGNTGNVWIAGTLRVAGTITGTLSGNASTASALTSMNISQFTNNSGYITSSGSISGSAGSATQVVTLQDSPPSGVNGQLWFETDTLRLKVYSSAASAWIDSFPMPDMALYYTKAGGAITGSVVIQQDLTVNGQISADGILKMNTTGTSYIRMGRFPASTTNSGEAWIGRASDRSVGTMTVQLGTASDRVFEVVDNPWSTVIFSAGMSSFSYKGNTIWHAGNLTNLNQLTNGPGYITGITSGNVTSALGYTPMYQAAQSGVNVNAFNGTGLYRGSTGDWTNRPTVVHNGGALLQIDTHPGNYHQQLFFDTGGNRLYMRSADAGTWGSWVTMWHSGNLTNLNQLSNGPGYITGITSSMVTTALGYTPYNSTNPNGYISSAANWFGAVTTSGTTNWNDVSNTRPGTGYTLLLGSHSNGPGPGNYYHAFNLEYASKDGTGNVTQLAISYGTPGDDIKMRGRYSGSWTSWVTFINSSNIGSYALTSLPAHNHDASAITSGTLANARTTASSSNGSDTIVLRNSSGYFDTEGIGVNKYIYLGGYRTFGLGNLGADGTQAKRYEIARLGIDYNDWNSVGTFEVELHESYYGKGLKKVYNIWYGYVSSSGLRLVEYRGDGANNFRVVIGGEVTVSGDHRYIPVYVDVNYYSSCHVVVKTNRSITGNSNSAVGAAYIFNSPSGTNISSFTADSTPEFTTSSSATIGGNTILHTGNYNSYSPTLTGGGASGTWAINITGSAGSASSASTATSATQVVTIQDAPPSGANGKLWWESDTGRLKVYYSAASAWVDATAIPDMSLYYPKAGGSITGDVTVQQTLNVIGNTLFQANSVIQGNLTIQGQLAAVTMSGPIRRNAHANGFLEGSYNNVGGNSYYTNPIYTIGSSYNPSDSSLSNMYGIGYSHPNFWGSGKTSSWGLYVCEAGTINATIGGGSTTIWAQNDIVAYSDARVKDNIEVVENAVEKIQAIRGVTFTRTDANEKDRNKRHAGVIAQEVLKVLPEVVSGTEEDMYSVAYGNMAALFIEAIKEQQVQISELKNLVDKLTDKLNN